MIFNSVVQSSPPPGGLKYTIRKSFDWGGPTEATPGEIVQYSQNEGSVTPPSSVIADDGTVIPLISGIGPLLSRVPTGYHYLFVMPAQSVTIS